MFPIPHVIAPKLNEHGTNTPIVEMKTISPPCCYRWNRHVWSARVCAVIGITAMAGCFCSAFIWTFAAKRNHYAFNGRSSAFCTRPVQILPLRQYRWLFIRLDMHGECVNRPNLIFLTPWTRFIDDVRKGFGNDTAGRFSPTL